MTQYKNAVCRGSYVLGSACGTCERCAEEQAKLKMQSPEYGKWVENGGVTKDELTALRKENFLLKQLSRELAVLGSMRALHELGFDPSEVLKWPKIEEEYKP